MAIRGPIPIQFADLFPMGACVLNVGPVYDFEKSTKDAKVQARHRDSNELLWAVDVMDLDEDARAKERAVTVKIAAPVQPVPPEKVSGTPFRPVEFDGLAVRGYVNANNRLAWSVTATAMRPPSGGVRRPGHDESKAA